MSLSESWSINLGMINLYNLYSTLVVSFRIMLPMIVLFFVRFFSQSTIHRYLLRLPFCRQISNPDTLNLKHTTKYIILIPVHLCLFISAVQECLFSPSCRKPSSLRETTSIPPRTWHRRRGHTLSHWGSPRDSATLMWRVLRTGRGETSGEKTGLTLLGSSLWMSLEVCCSGVWA